MAIGRIVRQDFRVTAQFPEQVNQQSNLDGAVRAFYAQDAVTVFQIKVSSISRKGPVNLVKHPIRVHLVSDVGFKHFYHIP
jgi:hypothetical protein